MNQDDVAAELNELLLMVASTRRVGMDYVAEMRVNPQPDIPAIADAMDSALGCIEALVEMVVKQDRLIQMLRPVLRGKREQVH